MLAGKPFQLRQQTLEHLSCVVQRNAQGADIALVDELIDELERAWEIKDIPRLEAVKNKAEALANQIIKPF